MIPTIRHVTSPSILMNQNEKKFEKDNHFRALGLFSVIVADLVGYTGAGVGLGYLVYKKWNAPWWVLLIFSVAGLIVAMYQLYLVSKREWADSQNTDDSNSADS